MRLLALLFAAALTVPSAAQPAPASLPSMSDPAISPDGHEIAFVSGGDIWTVPAAGGEAHLLITHPATESRPLYSPDGKRLAFVSTRTGAGNIYILTLATGDLQRLTFSDSPDRLDAWSADGQWIYFTSGVNDVAGQGDIFRVHSSGGTPLEVSKERYLAEFESAPSPDGTQIALIAKGISAAQWWRNGHAHIDETEIWLKPIAASGTYTKLLSADAKHAWPMWSPDGKTLYFMSDSSGSENLWSAPVAATLFGQRTHPLQTGPRPLALPRQRRQNHRLRARLQHLVRLHRFRQSRARPHPAPRLRRHARHYPPHRDHLPRPQSLARRQKNRHPRPRPPLRLLRHCPRRGTAHQDRRRRRHRPALVPRLRVHRLHRRAPRRRPSARALPLRHTQSPPPHHRPRLRRVTRLVPQRQVHRLHPG